MTKPAGFYASTVAHSSATDDWPTPQSFYDRLNKEFKFVLDVAASSRNALCPDYYGLDHPNPARRDALTKDWAAEAKALGGAIWMNPPYGLTIGAWMEKALATSQAGATVVCLVPARTCTTWFQDYAMYGSVRFVRGRITFGNATSGAPFPSAVVVFSPTGNPPEGSSAPTSAEHTAARSCTGEPLYVPVSCRWLSVSAPSTGG